MLEYKILVFKIGLKKKNRIIIITSLKKNQFCVFWFIILDILIAKLSNYDCIL